MLSIIGPPVLRMTFGQLVVQKVKGKLVSAALDAAIRLLPSLEGEE